MPNASLTIDGTEVISKVNGSTSIQIDTVESNDIKNAHGNVVGFRSVQIFDTVGTSTWTKPAGVNYIKVYVTGGGGGGGSHNQDDAQGGGGGPGGTSSFGSYCSATGGEEPETWAVGGYGGVATGGDINLYGNAGICGNIDGGGNEESSGVGGASYWGGTGRGGSVWGARSNPNGWGCGGSGTHVSTNNEGADGYKGAVIVEEYV